MNGNVNLYDTYKANKDGKRYRVTEVGNETVKLVKLNDEGTRKHAGGRPRILTIADLFKGYSRVNLPPVTVSKIEPQKPKQEEVEEVGTPSENAAEKQKQTVREINHPEAHTLEDTFEEFRKKNEEDIEILKAELKDRVRENIDLKKTISKMQQAHEAEVQDLKDQLMEAQAMANAANKYKDEVVAERNRYSEALDDDSITFEAILDMARVIRQSASAMHTMAARIEKETEGRI